MACQRVDDGRSDVGKTSDLAGHAFARCTPNDRWNIVQGVIADRKILDVTVVAGQNDGRTLQIKTLQ
jgi:hypothetical protein